MPKMKNKSKFKICQDIYARRVFSTKKLHSSERAKIVLEFISTTGCKAGTANVYFTLIRNGEKEKEDLNNKNNTKINKLKTKGKKQKKRDMEEVA